MHKQRQFQAKGFLIIKWIKKTAIEKRNSSGSIVILCWPHASFYGTTLFLNDLFLKDSKLL